MVSPASQALIPLFVQNARPIYVSLKEGCQASLWFRQTVIFGDVLKGVVGLASHVFTKRVSAADAGLAH
jgi:hypothetical protein